MLPKMMKSCLNPIGKMQKVPSKWMVQLAGRCWMSCSKTNIDAVSPQSVKTEP